MNVDLEACEEDQDTLKGQYYLKIGNKKSEEEKLVIRRVGKGFK